jgi:hypothetical protein
MGVWALCGPFDRYHYVQPLGFIQDQDSLKSTLQLYIPIPRRLVDYWILLKAMQLRLALLGIGDVFVRGSVICFLISLISFQLIATS